MSWINLSALWKILVFGLIAGPGLPALFAFGIRCPCRRARAQTAGAGGADPTAADRRQPGGYRHRRVLFPDCPGRYRLGYLRGLQDRSSRPRQALAAGPGASRARGYLIERVREHAVATFAERGLEWLRAGYPEGVPDVDYIPLFALLGSQLSEADVAAIAYELEDASDPKSADAIHEPSAPSPATSRTKSDVTRVRSPDWPRAAGRWPGPSISTRRTGPDSATTPHRKSRAAAAARRPACPAHCPWPTVPGPLCADPGPWPAVVASAPGRDSNPHCTVFEAALSAGWSTGQVPQRGRAERQSTC